MEFVLIEHANDALQHVLTRMPKKRATYGSDRTEKTEKRSDAVGRRSGAGDRGADGAVARQAGADGSDAAVKVAR
jgi:hypothetical protein